MRLFLGHAANMFSVYWIRMCVGHGGCLLRGLQLELSASFKTQLVRLLLLGATLRQRTFITVVTIRVYSTIVLFYPANNCIFIIASFICGELLTVCNIPSAN